ncbi:MAG TPA: HD domain-containing protein [Gemmatimonadales bacterium]|nr:HD domain-containing protein [Gemmatimonadales bacterium]
MAETGLLPPWAAVSAERRAHIERVAALMDGWADALRLPAVERERWRRAAWLHDALRDAPESELRRWAGGDTAPVDLLHGPAAANRAEQEGMSDRGVLDAVRWHSVGSDRWDAVGRALYSADFLEPGRSFDREARAALAGRFPADPDGVFRDVARARLLWLIRSGWPLPDTTVRMWNSLATPA